MTVLEGRGTVPDRSRADATGSGLLDPVRRARDVERVLGRPGVLAVAVVALVVVAYGNEIFNNHFTIDEDFFADRSVWQTWLRQGRWGMSLLAGLVVPRPVAPVVSSAIGVVGFAVALMVYLRTLTERRTVVLLAVWLGAVFPTLPFLLTFSTLAYGAGIAAVCTSVAFRLLMTGHSTERWLWAVPLYAFAIAVYQTFLFVMPFLLLGYLATTALRRRLALRTAVTAGGHTVLCTAAAVVLYLLVQAVLQRVTGIAQSDYVAGQIDVRGFLLDPVGRLASSARTVLQVLDADPGIFRGHARYIGPVLALSWVAVALGVLGRQGWRQAVWIPTLLAVGFAGLVLIESTTAGESQLRTLVHLPFVAAGTVALGLEAASRWGRRRWAGAVLTLGVGASALGLTVDMNRLFMSTEVLYQRDVALAFEFDRRTAQLVADAGADEQPVYLALIGTRPEQEGPATPRRDTIGYSFFEWSGGRSERAAAFVRLVTGRELAAAPPEVAARAARTVRSAPGWPLEGSVVLQDDLVILKMSEATRRQQARWCEAGVEDACP